MIKIYGLKNCSTCKKAFTEITKAGKEAEFIDVRANPLTGEEYATFFAIFGDNIINKRSTTWRNITPDERETAPITLITRYPVLLKRPLIVSKTQQTIGWDEKTQAYWL